MPANTQYDRPAAWGGEKYFDLEVPSGGTVQCQKLTPESLIMGGILQQADILSFTTQEEVINPAKGKPKKPQDRQQKKPTKAQQKAAEEAQISELLGDPAQLGRMMAMVDKITVAAVIQPTLTLHFTSTFDAKGEETRTEIPAAQRDKDAIYTDSIPIEDKMHIFQVSFGGVQAMQSFRELTDEDAGTLEDGEGAADTTE